MGPIFISYCRQDASLAVALAEDVRALGFEVWLDRELSGGHIWWDQILTSIRECAALVFAVSAHSLESEACQLECQYAIDLGKAVLPVIVDNGTSAGLLPAGLVEIQALDYRVRDHASALALGRAFARLPPARPLPEPLPAAPGRPVSAMDSLNALVVSPAGLNFEEQTALLLRLKERLDDPVHGRDARQLLEKLRRRDDLFAKVASEIDVVLSARRAAAPPPSNTSSEPPPATVSKPAARRRRYRFLLSKLFVLGFFATMMSLVQGVVMGGPPFIESQEFWQYWFARYLIQNSVVVLIVFAVLKFLVRTLIAPFRRSG